MADIGVEDSALLLDAKVRLERALVARFGLDDGLEAAPDALEYGIEHWARVGAMDNPIGYLYRVGQTSGTKLGRRWERLDALVEEPQTSIKPIDLDLQRALMTLSPPVRVALVLAYAHGYTYVEVASLLDLPVTTITNYLNRGLERLRKLVGDQ